MSVFLTCAEIAESYDVKVSTVREWIKSGQLRALKLPGPAGYRIRPEDLEAFEEKRTTTTEQEDKQ